MSGYVRHLRSLHAVGLAAALTVLAAGGSFAQSKSLDSINSTGLQFSTGATSPTTVRMRITQGGNIGVGLSTPTTSVEVSGTVSASAVYAKGVLMSVPVGVIMPWHKNLSGVPNLPNGWLECNGQTVSEAASPLNGQTLPNLNGQVYAGNRGYYLRGGNTSGSFNNSSYFTGNGNLYRFGTSSGSYFGVGYADWYFTENGTLGDASYSSSDNTLGVRRFQVAAMTVVYIIKIK